MRILITGGSSQIGTAIAERNIRKGNQVVYTCSSEESLKETEEVYRARKIKAKGIVLKLDGSDGGFGGAFDGELAAGIDALILNAASAVKKLRVFHETDFGVVRDSVEQNILGNVRLIQAVLPSMVERKLGRIVFISSVTVCMGTGRYGVYNLTKGAIEALLLNLAVDYGQHNVLSNIVRPGTIKTERTKRFWSREKYVERIGAIIPQGRMGTPEQVAESLDPLLSETSYMNGSIVTVSGGFPFFRSEGL
jgi:3-oxoacyl-[acyl-carrier protein] reductase